MPPPRPHLQPHNCAAAGIAAAASGCAGLRFASAASRLAFGHPFHPSRGPVTEIQIGFFCHHIITIKNLKNKNTLASRFL